MVYTGDKRPSNKIVVGGTPLVTELNIETATNCIPGRLVIKGTNDDDIVIGTAAGAVLGWLGYEQTSPEFLPTDKTTAFAAGAKAPVLNGNFKLLGHLASGQNVTKGARLVAGANGELIAATAAATASGATGVTSSAATAPVTGSVGSQGMIVAIALESVNASSAAADIIVLSLI